MVQTNQKLHLGCGPNYFSGWVNVDLDSPIADRLLDLTEPLPYENSSVSHIFNEHFIEHITRENAVAFLKECYRVLSPHGAIRISTPSLRYLIHCYSSNNTSEWGDLWQPTTRCQLMNEGMRSWGHQFIYDAEELVRVLGEAGFQSIAFQTYRQSADEVLVGLETRPFHNELIVEARKSLAIDVGVDFSVAINNETSWNSNSTTNGHELEQHLVQVELESAARAELIESQSARLVQVELESAARAELIESQSARLVQVELESAARAELIESQSARMLEMANELKAFQSSWYGKTKLFLNKLRNKFLSGCA